jgi:hypothetical protein
LIRAIQQSFPVEAIADEATTPDDNKKLAGFLLTNERGGKVKVFVETDTGIVRRVDGTTPQGNTTALLSAYKETGGVKLPSKVNLKVNGNELLSFTVDSVELNRTLDDLLFDKPKG